METALIGLLGILIGIFLTERLRRQSRIESYATLVFDKRLEIYEELYARVCASGEIASDVIENTNYSSKQRHEIISGAIHEICGWYDKHDMYINEELFLHCASLLIGVEEIHDIKDDKEKKDLIKQFQDDFHSAKKMIRKECGIQDIEKMFSSITKPKHKSQIIDYYRQKKRELGMRGKWD